jgi:hypothetical protein
MGLMMGVESAATASLENIQTRKIVLVVMPLSAVIVFMTGRVISVPLSS